MSVETIDIGRRVVACVDARPIPGMLLRCEMITAATGRVIAVTPTRMLLTDGSILGARRDWCSWKSGEWSSWWYPDLSDAITEVSIIVLVRDAWGQCVWDREEWIDANGVRCVEWTAHMNDGTTASFSGSDDGEALVLALESAPGVIT